MPPAGRPAGALDEQALAELPAEHVDISLYRTAWIPERGDTNPLYTDPHTNRFGTADGTVYTGSSEAVAWAETCRNKPREISDSNPFGVANVTVDDIRRFPNTPINRLVPARALFLLEFSFGRVVDLRGDAARQVLQRAGMASDDLIADIYGRCRDLAAAAVSLGWEAIIVPSAAWERAPGFCVPVFKPAGVLRMVGAQLLAEAALPTVGIAHLTRYPAGARPIWLP